MTSKKGGNLFSKSDKFLLKLTWNKLQGKIDSLAINSFDNMFQARPCPFIQIFLKLMVKSGQNLNRIWRKSGENLDKIRVKSG